MNDSIGGTEPIDWQAVAARQQQYNIALIRAALGDVGDLDRQEHQFIAQIAWDGGHLELASLLRKARQAAQVGRPASDSAPVPREPIGHDANPGAAGSTAGDGSQAHRGDLGPVEGRAGL